MDLHILQFQPIPSTQTTDDYLNALKNITNGGARIIMVAATSTPQVEILMKAQEMGLINKEYVWLMMGDTTADLSKAIVQHNENYTTNQINYATQYQGLFFFDNWLSLNGYPPFETFLDQWASLNPEA